MLWVDRFYFCSKGVREGIQFIRVPYKRPTSIHVCYVRCLAKRNVKYWFLFVHKKYLHFTIKYNMYKKSQINASISQGMNVVMAVK